MSTELDRSLVLGRGVPMLWSVCQVIQEVFSGARIEACIDIYRTAESRTSSQVGHLTTGKMVDHRHLTTGKISVHGGGFQHAAFLIAYL